MIARGEPGAGIPLLRRALATLQAERHHVLGTVFTRALAEGLAHSGQFDEARATIAEAIALAEQRGETFDFPDLLRAKGEILLAGPQPDVASAESSLVWSLTLAEKQSALGWELRAAIQLARLWAQHWRAPDARDMLAGICQRFTEGSGMVDLRTASELLEELRHISHGLEPIYPADGGIG
jgi:predicted ATPase